MTPDRHGIPVDRVLYGADQFQRSGAGSASASPLERTRQASRYSTKANHVQMDQRAESSYNAQSDDLTIDEAAIQLRQEAQIINAGDVPIGEVQSSSCADKEAQAGKVQDLLRQPRKPDSRISPYGTTGRGKEIITQP